MSSPINGAQPAPLPVFEFVGRFDLEPMNSAVDSAARDVAESARSRQQQALANAGGARPAGSRTVRISNVGELEPESMLLKSLARTPSVASLLISDSRAASPMLSERAGFAAPGGASGSSSAAGSQVYGRPASAGTAAHAAAVKAGLARVLDASTAGGRRIGSLELELAPPPAAVAAPSVVSEDDAAEGSGVSGSGGTNYMVDALPELLARVDDAVDALTLRLPRLDPDGGEKLSELLARNSALRVLSVVAAEELTCDAVLALAEGLRSNAHLEELRLERVAEADADEAAAIVADAVRTGGARSRSVPPLRLVLNGADAVQILA